MKIASSNGTKVVLYLYLRCFLSNNLSLLCVKVYDLTSDRTLPHWVRERKKRSMTKDENKMSKLELIQDFAMPTVCNVINMTNDCEHIIIGGTYPPCIKCYTVSDLSMKFHRGLNCEVVSLKTLSEDFGKFVLLQSDRTLNFHAPYGAHYSLRIPKFGRSMQYNSGLCDLYIAATGDEIYRLNLEEGRFKKPVSIGFTGCNKMHFNPVYPLLAFGGESNICKLWDSRSKKIAAQVDVKRSIGSEDDIQISEVKFDESGLTFGIGTNGGECILYDIRSSKPFYIKRHSYGLPVMDIQFHSDSRTVISADKNVLKIWERDGDIIGRTVTNIETPTDINMTQIVKDERGQSGLILIAGNQSKVMSYFVPRLGPAPRWCSFLEGITEELEEASPASVYENHKFLTKTEVDNLGASSLLGTDVLRGYMHGFFMDMKMYAKLSAANKPFEYNKYMKKKINDKIDGQRENRILSKKKLPKVNLNLAHKMRKKNNSGVMAMDDERFAGLFERDDFEQDEDSVEYKLRNPNKSINSSGKDISGHHGFQKMYTSTYVHGELIRWKDFETNDVGESTKSDSKIFDEETDGYKMSELPRNVSHIEATFGHTMERRKKAQLQKELNLIPLNSRMRNIGDSERSDKYLYYKKHTTSYDLNPKRKRQKYSKDVVDSLSFEAR